MAFPASLREISQGAFAACKCLRTVEFGEGLETLGTDQYPDTGEVWLGLFEGSTLENIKLPSTLKRIEDRVFKDCKSLKSVSLPERLEYVGKWCFSGSALVSINYPSALKTVEQNTFRECKDLTTVEFPEGLEKIGLEAFMTSGIEHVEFPTSLRTIAQGAFAECKNLTNVTLNEGLEALGTDEYPPKEENF